MPLRRHDPDPWPAWTWSTDDEGRLFARPTVLIAGDERLATAIVRRCVLDDGVLVAGPLVPLEEATDAILERRPDVALLCGSTDDRALHAAMYALSERTGATRVGLVVRLGRTTRCLMLGDADELTDALVERLTGDPSRRR